MVVDTGFFHNFVGHVSGFYLAVHWKAAIDERAVPDVVVAFTMTFENTAMPVKLFAHGFFVGRHQA
jgi:hypothetical protein